MAGGRKKRRFQRLMGKSPHKKESFDNTVSNSEHSQEPVKKEYKNNFSRIYDIHYKKLAMIPLVLLVLSLIVIGVNFATTGDFINKGVSLKGGVTLTIPYNESVDVVALELFLKDSFASGDLNVRELSEFGVQQGVIIEASDIAPDKLLDEVKQFIGDFGNSYSLEEIGSSLGKSFFKQTMIAVLLAFLFMGLVVFWYFRTIVPSGAVILAAFSDIIITLAIVDLMGIKISTAGIAAFLMLIGYSVDTDILLSTRVLKKKEGTVMSRIYGAMKTGLTMNGTTIVAISVGLIVTDSEVIKQIMTIILIGLFVDIINTWIQNVSILRYYLEKKGIK